MVKKIGILTRKQNKPFGFICVYFLGKILSEQNIIFESAENIKIKKSISENLIKKVVKPVVKAVINPKRVPVAKSSLKKLTIGHIINLKLQMERLQEELKNIKEQLDNDVEDGDEDKDVDEDGDKDVDED